MIKLEVLFKKIHPDAVLPTRNHSNRELNDYEINRLTEENEKFEKERPDMYEGGYRIGFPFEIDENGQPTNKLIGTGDTGYDVFSVEDKVIPAKGSAIVDIGIELAYVSPGYWFRVEGRSGLGFKHSIQPHFGVMDNPYRNNCAIKLYNLSDNDYSVVKDDKIAQFIFYPIVEPQIGWTENKIETPRNENGLGSSGR